MQIRLATMDDAMAIEALVADSYAKYVERIGRKPGPMLDDYRVRIEAGSTFVAELGGEVAGVLVLIVEADAVQVENVAVSSARQGAGVGRALLGFAEAEARRRSLDRLTLYTNEKMTENLAMYPALGWRECGRGEQDGFSRVFFEKTL